MLVLVCYGFQLSSFPISWTLRFVFPVKDMKKPSLSQQIALQMALDVCMAGGKDLIQQVFRKAAFRLKIG